MNEIFACSNLVLSLFQSNSLVNTLTFEKTNEIDLNKENIYPLVNLDLIDTIVNDNDIVINYTISVLEQRDKDNQLNNNKIFGSNMIDNLSETHSIATQFINNLRRQQNDEMVEIVTLSNLEMLKLNNMNELDGVRFTISLSIPNGTTC